MGYIFTMEYYSSIKKKEIMLFVVRWMQLEIIILSSIKSEREGQYITYMWNLKYGTKEPIYSNRLPDIENRLWLPRGKGKGVGWTGTLGLVDANYYI